MPGVRKELRLSKVARRLLRELDAAAASLYVDACTSREEQDEVNSAYANAERRLKDYIASLEAE